MIYLIIPIAITLLWVMFLAYTQIKAKWNDLRWEVKAAGAVVVLFGWLLDAALNIVPGLVLGFGNWTISQKCKRLRKEDMGWRGDVAAYICTNWLNPFDNGHC